MLQINNYISDILDGVIPANEFIKLACQRHLDNLRDQKKSFFPYYFDEQYAEGIIEYCELFRHWEGEWAGQNIHLESHQHFYFGSIFGWKHENTDLRRFSTAYKQVPRKNGKTTEAALMGGVHLGVEEEAGAQVWAAATKEDQAMIVVNCLGQMISRTPELRNNYKFGQYQDKIKRVIKLDLSGFMAPNGRDSKTQDGYNPSFGIIDEYHAHETDDRVNVLESGMGARRQPIIIIITTSGSNKEFPCYKVMRKMCIDIVRGIIKDESIFVMIFEPDKDDEWDNPDVWKKVNPNYDISVKLEYLEKRFLKAKNQGGTLEVDFKIKNLNMWVDAPDVWIPDDKIKTNMMKLPELKGMLCHGGLDIAGVGDLNAFCLEFEIDGVFKNLFMFWCPEIKVVQRKDKVDYATWVKDGWLKTTPGDVIDYKVIVSDIANACQLYRVKSVAYDPMYKSDQIIFDLIDIGVEMNPMAQSMKEISYPTKEFYKLIVASMWHFENPIVRWMFGNAYCTTDANDNWKLIKPANRKGTALKSSDKIDGLIAGLMANGERISGLNTGTSKYETQDLITL